jgi:peptidoglycan/LPS O-acetylase OafA/YrhL
MPDAQMLQSHNSISETSRGTKRAETKQICGLDLIRFAAAFLVVIHHLAFVTSDALPGTRPILSKFAPYTWEGWIGVEVFFVLSGFVIAYSAARATPQSFAVSRLLRLYPAVWICSTLTALAILWDHTPIESDHLFRHWITTFFLFPKGGMVDTIYWTLKVEIVFYVFIFLLLLTRKFHRVGSIISVLGAASSAGWIYTALLRTSVPSTTFGRYVVGFYRGYPFDDPLLMRFAPFFATGVLLWLCFLNKVSIGRVVALVLCSIGSVAEICIHASWLCEHLTVQLSPVLPLILWLACLVAIVCSIKWNAVIAKLLGEHGVRICRILGLMTYPLYLIHNRVGFIAIGRLAAHAPLYSDVAAVITAMIVASFFITRYLEDPLRRIVRTLLENWIPAPKLKPPLAASLP